MFLVIALRGVSINRFFQIKNERKPWLGASGFRLQMVYRGRWPIFSRIDLSKMTCQLELIRIVR